MHCREAKVFVGAQQLQFMPNAQLGNQGVNRSDLNTRPAAGISDFSRFNMVCSIRLQHRQSGEALDDLRSVPWPSKSLKQFLKDNAGADHHICTEQGILERDHCGLDNPTVSAQGQ